MDRGVVGSRGWWVARGVGRGCKGWWGPQGGGVQG